jgi:F-type H+-transporting ATPase subunit b
MWLIRRAHLGLGAAVACVVLIAVPCFAAEGGGIDRPTWNMIMRLVNFGILAFVIYKYGKDPLVKFLAGKRASVVLSLEELEKEKEYLNQQEEEQSALMAGIDEKIGSIKEYYHRLGQDEKQKIMERATISRDHMLEDAKLRADRELEKAKERFRAEVVGMALELAESRIRQNITVADERKLVREYIDQLSSLGG